MLSFTTILLILFIIIGIYLIFTNRLEGRPKIIIIFSIVICLIYIIMNSSLFKTSTSSPIDASIITYVPPINASIPLIGTPIPLIDTTSPTFSLSTWINITDWNPGTKKTVFSMTNSISDYTPKIVLGLHKNELIITYYTTPITAQNVNWLAKTNLNNIKNISEYDIKTSLNEYINAKDEYINASNSERNSEGWFYVTTNYDGTYGDATMQLNYAAGYRTPTFISISPINAIRDNTQSKLDLLINARKKYDGGTTGLTDSNAQTIYTPSSRNLKYGANINSQISTDYELIPASVMEYPIDYDQAILLQPRYTYYNDSDLYKYNNALSTYESSDISQNPQVKWVTGDPSEDYSLETITIPQIRIQKWIHIAISFGENSVDTYVDGKLVDSHISTGNVQHVTNVSNDTTLNWGGFIGYISSYNYLPNFLTPQDVLALYTKGV